MHRLPRPCRRRALAAALLLLPLACSKGGQTEGAKSEVKLAESHALVGLFGLTEFGSFPVVPSPGRAYTDAGDLRLKSNGNYTVRRAGQESGEDGYLLGKDGQFTILVRRSGLATLRWPGGYDLAEQPVGEMCFFSALNPDRQPFFCGLYAAVRLSGSRPVDGAWHALGVRLIYATTTVPDQDQVGRAFFGEMTVATDRTITGSVLIQSNGGALPTFGGNIDNTSATDGHCLVNLDFISGTTQRRVYEGGSGFNNLLGVATRTSDGDVSILAMTKKFPASNVPDKVRVAGTFFCAGYAIFTDPNNPGVDGPVGQLRLSEANSTGQGSWNLSALSSKGRQFQKSGAYTIANDGRLTLVDTRTNETHLGAIDQKYNCVMIVDLTRQTGSPPEVELMICTRLKQP